MRSWVDPADLYMVFGGFRPSTTNFGPDGSTRSAPSRRRVVATTHITTWWVYTIPLPTGVSWWRDGIRDPPHDRRTFGFWNPHGDRPEVSDYY